jgi:hypothetical protein
MLNKEELFKILYVYLYPKYVDTQCSKLLGMKALLYDVHY